LFYVAACSDGIVIYEGVTKDTHGQALLDQYASPLANFHIL